MDWAIGVEPTKLMALTSRVFEQDVDGLLVAVDHVEHTGGQAGLGEDLRR